MTQQPQREAVFAAVKAVLGSSYKSGVPTSLSDQQRKQVLEQLIKGFQTKKIALKDTAANREKLKSAELMKAYVSGLLNNWLRRDPRLNGKVNNSSPAKPGTIPNAVNEADAAKALQLSKTTITKKST